MNPINPDTHNVNGNTINVDWVENPLNAVEQPSYYFRLFMLNEHAVTSIRMTGSGDSLQNKIQGQQQITIAETGVTSFNIQDVTIESYVAPNFVSRNAEIFKFRMKILDPNGASLLDKIYLASQELGVKNYFKVPIMLELRFRGYNPYDGGSFIDGISPLSDPSSGPESQPRTWYWLCMITNIDAQLGITGSEYNLEMIALDDFGLTNNIINTNVSFSAPVSTVQEMFDAWIESMNARDIELYGYARHIYKVDIKGLEGIDVGNLNVDPNVGSWKINWQDDAHTPSRARGTEQIDQDKQIAQGSIGMSLLGLVEYIMSNTEEGQKLAIRSDTTEKPGNLLDYAIIYKISPKISFRSDSISGGAAYFDKILNDYNYEFTFTITPYKSDNVILSDEQVADLGNISEQTRRIQNKVEEKRLRKRYDYIFTGHNIDIIDFNIKVDNLWRATFPMFNGRNNYGSHAVGKLTNDAHVSSTPVNTGLAVSKQSVQEQYVENSRELTKVNSAIEDQVNSGYGGFDSNILNLSRRQVELEQSMSEVDTLRFDPTNGRSNDVAAGMASRFGAPSVYAEDLGGTMSGSAANVSFSPTSTPITFDADVTRSENETLGIVESGDTKGRGLFATVINQAYGGIGNLIRMTLEVRGDPYWLGYTGLEERYDAQVAEANEIHPLFKDGDQQFLFTFKFPGEYDDNGAPVLSESNVYNGIYTVLKAEHIFSGGQFKQRLEAIKDMSTNTQGIYFETQSAPIDNDIHVMGLLSGTGSTDPSEFGVVSRIEQAVNDAVNMTTKRVEEFGDLVSQSALELSNPSTILRSTLAVDVNLDRPLLGKDQIDSLRDSVNGFTGGLDLL